MMPQPTISWLFFLSFHDGIFIIFAPQNSIKEKYKYTNIETIELTNGKHEVTDNPPRWFKEQFEKEFAEV